MGSLERGCFCVVLEPCSPLGRFSAQAGPVALLPAHSEGEGNETCSGRIRDSGCRRTTRRVVAMNYRFGLSLGKTEFDGQIYGAASAAADCMKALVPFFLFAAIKNKAWSQAAASMLVWGVVTAYSLTSAFGHAALNRFDVAGQRAHESTVYEETRADLASAREQLGWIPQHRPMMAVKAEIEGFKGQ